MLGKFALAASIMGQRQQFDRHLGDLPDIAVLRTLFDPDPARLPTVSVQFTSLNGYEALGGYKRSSQH